MRIFVTGAQGFVGRYYVAYALGENPSAIVLGVGRSARNDATFTHNVRWGNASIPAPLPIDMRRALANERYSYQAADLADRNTITALLRAFAPDVVVHLASGLRDDDPVRLFSTNVIGSMVFVETVAAAVPGVTKIVLGSTGGVYGIPDPNALPIAETARCAPIDLYSASKLSSEHVTSIVARRTNLPVVWARLFNLVGPGQDERHVCGRLASQAAAIARSIAPPKVEVGNLDATRDFIDVRDVAQGLSVLATAGVPGTPYNVASGIEADIASVLKATLRAAGVEGKTEIVKLPPRAEDIPRHYGDIGRIKALGYLPCYTLDESIATVVSFYLTEAEAAAR